MIRGYAKLGGVDDIQIAVTLEMSVREARQLLKQTSSVLEYPSSHVAGVIRSLLSKIVDRVETDHGREPDDTADTEEPAGPF